MICLSKSRLDQISSAFSRLIRGALGFTRMVPFKRIHEFVGLNDLKEFLEYWFCVRSFEAVTLKGLPDFFGEFNALNGRETVLRRSARASTMENTALSAKKASKFPDLVDVYAPMALKYREQLFGLFLEQKDYKCFLKKEMLDKVIFRGTDVKKAVQELNDFYYNLFCV